MYIVMRKTPGDTVSMPGVPELILCEMCTRLEPTAPRSGTSRHYSSIPDGQSACYKDPINDDVTQLQYSKLFFFNSPILYH